MKGDEYLKQVGKTIYRITSEVDPKVTIAMKTRSMRKPIVESIPQSHTLMLDLNSSRWKGSDAFWGRLWVAGIIHNFGGRTFIGGNLKHDATNAPDLLHDPRQTVSRQKKNGHEQYPDQSYGNPVLIAKQLYEKWLPVMEKVYR